MYNVLYLQISNALILFMFMMMISSSISKSGTSMARYNGATVGTA